MLSWALSVFCLKSVANWRLSLFSFSLNVVCHSAQDGKDLCAEEGQHAWLTLIRNKLTYLLLRD